jgi:hypothetical protein
VRALRSFLNLLVPGMGMALVLGAVLFGESIAVQLFLVVAGLLMTEAGFFRLADRFLPDERKYMALRAELDHFTNLVRQLNAAALARDREDDQANRFLFEEVRKKMHQSVDQMVRFAGKTAEEIDPEEAGDGWMEEEEAKTEPPPE